MLRKAGHISTLTLGLGVLFSVVAAGCNVDKLRIRTRSPEGPVDAQLMADRPEAIEEGVDIAIVARREIDIVEALVEHRTRYHQLLRELNEYYRAHGDATKLTWADFEMSGLRTVKAFRYLMDAEVASDTLRPADSIPEADELFAKGMDLMRRGGHGIPAVYRQDHMIEAAELFRNLIELYPSSDKIDDAAFYCGEIHKEYLPGQELIAVNWYERAWTWDPATPHAARFQAAVVYDYRLHDRDRALELYQEALKHEAGNSSNVRFATRRIHQLTGGAGTGTGPPTTASP